MVLCVKMFENKKLPRKKRWWVMSWHKGWKAVPNALHVEVCTRCGCRRL